VSCRRKPYPHELAILLPSQTCTGRKRRRGFLQVANLPSVTSTEVARHRFLIVLGARTPRWIEKHFFVKTTRNVRCLIADVTVERFSRYGLRSVGTVLSVCCSAAGWVRLRYPAWQTCSLGLAVSYAGLWSVTDTQ